MSRASGQLTARSTSNTSRQGTIHPENPDLVNSLLEGDQPNDNRKQTKKSDRKTPNDQPKPSPTKTADKDNKSVSFEPTPDARASPIATKQEAEGNDLEPGGKNEKGEDSEPIETKEREEEESEKVADRGEGSKSVEESKSEEEPVSENPDVGVNENAVTESTKPEEEASDPAVKESNTAIPDRREDTDKTPTPQSEPSQQQRHGEDDTDATVKEDTEVNANVQEGEKPHRFVSVNWDSENFDSKAPKEAEVNDNKNDIPEEPSGPAVPAGEPDRNTLKSSASTSSELAGLHSPSRKSLNIDLGDELSKSGERDEDEEEVTPKAPEEGGSEAEKAPEVEQKSGPGPTYSAVSPRASRSSFHQANAAAASSSLNLEDAQHPRFTTPYSSQRLKSQGTAAKRSTSVSTITKDSLDSYRAPVEEEEKEESKFTADSLEIERDSLDISSEKKEDINVSQQNAEPVENDKSNAVPEVDDISNDSLQNSSSELAGVSDDTVKDKSDKVEPVPESDLRTHRSGTEENIKNERFSVVSVSNREKELSGPSIVDTKDKEKVDEEDHEEEEGKDVIPPVEFVIKPDLTKPGPSRYSSASGSGRNSDSYFRDKGGYVTSSSASLNSKRRSSRTTPSTRKVFVESPTFTKEEEGEYRYVKSRLDNLEDSGRFDTYRELDMAAVQRQGGFDHVPSGKMPEKRVRYSGVDTQYGDNNRVTDYEGRQEFVNKNVGFSSQGYQGGENRGNNNNIASTDESDKENSRRNSLARDTQDLRQAYYGDSSTQQHRPQPHTNLQYALPPPDQQQQQQQQQQQPHLRPAVSEGYQSPGFYSKLYSQQQGYSNVARLVQQPTHSEHNQGGEYIDPARQRDMPGMQHGHYYSQHYSQNPSPPPAGVLQLPQGSGDQSGKWPSHSTEDRQPRQLPQQGDQQERKPPVKGLALPTGPSYDPVDEEDLKREAEYQQGLKTRIDSGYRRAEETFIPDLSLGQGRIHVQGQRDQGFPQGHHRGQGSGRYGVDQSRDSLDYDSQDTGRGYDQMGAGNFHRDSLDMYDGRLHHHQQQQQHGQIYDDQRIPDSDRYQDYGADEYSDYETTAHEQRVNPQVQPRFYNPQYDERLHQAQPLNTDRSDVGASTSRTRDDEAGYYVTPNVNEYGRGEGQEEEEVMDAVRPKPPKYDYVEHNKGDYGKQPPKSYQRIHEISKEEKDKLDEIFIKPKLKPKGGILKKRGPSQASVASQRSQPSDAGRKPEEWPEEPVQTDDGSQLSAAEQVWARRASTLANQRQDAKKGGKKGAGPSLKKYNSDSSINQVSNPTRNQSYQQIREAHQQYNQYPDQRSPQGRHRQQPPPPQQRLQQQQQQQQQYQHQPPSYNPQQQQQQQIQQPVSYQQQQHQQQFQPPPPPQQQQQYQQQFQPPPSQQQHQQQFQPPPSQQQHQQQAVQAPVSRDKRAFLTDLPTPVNDGSYGYNQEAPSSPPQEIQLQPIKQQIVTEDGQRISVDVNLKLISPPPSHQQPQQNHQHQQPSQQQQLFYGAGRGRQYPTEPAHYDLDDDLDAGYGQGYLGAYHRIELADAYPSPRERYSADEALRTLYDSRTEVNPYGKIPPISPSREGHPSSAPVHDQGGSYMDMFLKQRRQEEKPWYKVYNLHDFRKMKKEVHLGTLGPDLDSEILRERKEKVQRQSEYAKRVMDKNRQDMVSRKPPSFPRPRENDDIMNRRKVAVEYAKNVPKPTVKPRPTEYNNYELASEKSPIARSHKKTTSNRESPSKNSHISPSPSVPKKEKEVEMVNLDKMRQRYEEDKQNEAMIRRNTGSAGGMHGYYTETV